VVGSGVAALGAELSDKQLEKVIVVEHELLGEYTADGYVIALEQLVKQADPDYVFFRIPTRFATSRQRSRRGFAGC
jgi:electron transfer flavoprotein alpha subunit